MTLATLTPSAVELARTPHQTQVLEAASSAAMAYAKEMNDYETYMQMWQVYILSRRKTTELVKAEIERGNTRVTDTEYGFTKMQWSRRIKELSVPVDVIAEYFDELVSNGWQPSINGLLRSASGGDIDHEANAVNEIRHGAKVLREHGWTFAQIHEIVDEVKE